MIRIYLNDSEKFQDTITEFLKWGSDNIENPDLRDRVFFYWRLLTVNTNAAKKMFLQEKQPIEY